MPAAVVVVGALSAIGTAAAGAVGVSLVAGGLAATMVGGAIVGAVAGGIISAVRGGNILKGVLVGAGVGALAGAVAFAAAPGGAAAAGGGGAAVTGTEAAALTGTAPAAVPTAAAETTGGLVAAEGGGTALQGTSYAAGSSIGAPTGNAALASAPTVSASAPAAATKAGLTAGEKLLAGSSLVGGLGQAYSADAEADAQQEQLDELARQKEIDYQRSLQTYTPGMRAMTGFDRNLADPGYFAQGAAPTGQAATAPGLIPQVTQSTMFERLSGPGALSQPLTVEQRTTSPGLIPA